MLTPSVNVVQSAFPEDLQGEISGLSRCISNLGSSLGTAVGGTILVSSLAKSSYAAAMIVLAAHRASSGSARRCSSQPDEHGQRTMSEESSDVMLAVAADEPEDAYPQRRQDECDE